MKTYDFLIIGAGIFGMSTAIELRKRKYSVAVLNPGSIPHPLAASTDISKAVRMEYGSDREYMDMAEICIKRWREWNEFFGTTLYHEVGLVMLSRNKFSAQKHSFENHCRENLARKGYPTEQIPQGDISKRFPAFSAANYRDACFNPVAGYVESGRVIETLANYARELGIDIHQNQTASALITEKGNLIALKTREGNTWQAGQSIVCTGSHSPYLVPDLKPYIKVSGHSLFHFRPKDPRLFTPPNMGVFMADISNSGWYGFPLHPSEGVVKIGKHGMGEVLHPDHDERIVSAEEVAACRAFLQEAIPALAESPLAYTRKCLYTDTLDGHFWIDQHPEIKGLAVSTGGSGHGMKMGPILGEMTADMAEGKKHRFSERYRWRHLDADTVQQEEARFYQR